MKQPSRWWKHKWYSSENLERGRWVRLRDPTNWHDGWGEADEEAAHYYRRLVAWYIGEARRWMRTYRAMKPVIDVLGHNYAVLKAESDRMYQQAVAQSEELARIVARTKELEAQVEAELAKP